MGKTEREIKLREVERNLNWEKREKKKEKRFEQERREKRWWGDCSGKVSPGNAIVAWDLSRSLSFCHCLSSLKLWQNENNISDQKSSDLIPNSSDNEWDKLVHLKLSVVCSILHNFVVGNAKWVDKSRGSFIVELRFGLIYNMGVHGRDLNRGNPSAVLSSVYWNPQLRSNSSTPFLFHLKFRKIILWLCVGWRWLIGFVDVDVTCYG